MYTSTSTYCICCKIDPTSRRWKPKDLWGLPLWWLQIQACAFLKTCRACTWNFLAAHLSHSAPPCLNRAKIHHFASAHMLFHSCLTRVLRDPSCICFYTFCLWACITQTHSAFFSQRHNTLLQQSGFFLHIRALATLSFSVPFLLSIWIHHDRAASGVSLWMSMLFSVRDGWWWMQAAYTTLESFSASWNGFITAEEVATV